MNAIGVTRVSTAMQGESGLGLDAQKATIVDECDRHLWDLLEIHTDVISSRYDRPELDRAIARIEAGEAKVLVVAKLDRLCRSTQEFCGLLQRSLDNDWTLHIADLGVDLSTPMGKLLARVLASFAEFERDMISQRTKEALAALKASGVRLGRPVETLEHVEAQIEFYVKDCRYSYDKAAWMMNRDGLKPPRSERWTARQIWAVYQRIKDDGKARTLIP